MASVEPQRHYAGPAGGHAWLLLASGLLAGLAQGIRANGLLLLVAPLTATRGGAAAPGAPSCLGWPLPSPGGWRGASRCSCAPG